MPNAAALQCTNHGTRLNTMLWRTDTNTAVPNSTLNIGSRAQGGVVGGWIALACCFPISMRLDEDSARTCWEPTCFSARLLLARYPICAVKRYWKILRCCVTLCCSADDGVHMVWYGMEVNGCGRAVSWRLDGCIWSWCTRLGSATALSWSGNSYAYCRVSLICAYGVLAVMLNQGSSFSIRRRRPVVVEVPTRFYILCHNTTRSIVGCLAPG